MIRGGGGLDYADHDWYRRELIGKHLTVPEDPRYEAPSLDRICFEIPHVQDIIGTINLSYRVHATMCYLIGLLQTML